MRSCEICASIAVGRCHTSRSLAHRPPPPPPSPVLLLMAIGPIYFGSKASVLTDDEKQEAKDNGVEQEIMTNSDAAMFPVFASCALFGCVLSFPGPDLTGPAPPRRRLGARFPHCVVRHSLGTAMNAWDAHLCADCFSFFLMPRSNAFPTDWCHPGSTACSRCSARSTSTF